jgi:hypothetical protein
LLISTPGWRSIVPEKDQGERATLLVCAAVEAGCVW